MVIDEGQIVESASHDELMKKNGLYREMVNRQFQIDSEREEAGLTPDMLE